LEGYMRRRCYGAVSWHERADVIERRRALELTPNATEIDATERLRYHEAGHAVVACALGADVTEIVVDASGGVCRQRNVSPKSEDRLTCLAAGYQAERLLGDCGGGHCAVDDIADMMMILSELPAHERQPTLDRAQDRAADLVLEHHRLIREVADALRDRGDRLDQRAIRALLEARGLGERPKPSTSAPVSRMPARVIASEADRMRYE
jgi:hypothetical protein